MAAKKSTPIPVTWVAKLLSETKGAKRASIITLIAFGLLGLLYAIYGLLFLGQVYPNVFVGGTRYSGLDQSEVQAKLTQAIEATLAQPLTLTFEDKTYTISAKDANWTANVTDTAQRVVGVGRNSTWYWNLYERATAPFYARKLTITADLDENYLKTTVATVAESVDTPALDASAGYDGEKLVVNYEHAGQVIDQEAVIENILSHWSSGSTQPITLSRTEQKPSVVIDSEEQLRAAAETLSTHRATLTWPTGKKELGKNEVRELIDFPGAKKVGVLSLNKILTASFTENKTKSYLQALAAESINQPAKEPKLGIKDGKVVIVDASATGKVVDIETSAIAVLAAVLAEGNQTVELAFKAESPLITAENIDSLGIKEIIGRGETSFVGSPQNRRVNIANGVRLLQSSLVKPGDEFSTVKTLGAVDGTTGFLPELVIKENRTTPEFGGGLCQVSTTLFRSVLNASLKVTERQNHSYRVSYYEPPIGLDATIYLPKPDFKFLNDTGHYILVQGQVVGSKVIFELWGTKDGRSSTVSEPIVTNVLPPPPEVRVETDTLFRGEVKQTDHAHEGATAVAYYTVMKDGKVLYKQTFKSVYKPWAARFLVGTKEPPAPPPAIP